MDSKKRFLLSTSLLTACLLSRGASAQDEAAAEALFNKGVAEMQAGKYDTACPKIAESQRLDPRTGTLFTLAECEAKAGLIATALVHYEDYLRAADALPAAQKQRHGQRIDIARAQKAALAPEVPTLKLVLPAGAPADLVISRDGTDLSAASMGVALPVDPGEHLIVTTAPGGQPFEQEISIAKRERKTVEIEWNKAPPPDPSATGTAGPDKPPPGAGVSGRRIGTYVVGGVGLAGLVVGGVMGGLALSAKSDVDAHCPDLKCDATGSSALSQGRTTGLVSTIGLGVGARRRRHRRDPLPHRASARPATGPPAGR
ncbi:MAG: hypothetical protein R3F14_13465 [Polyangiaceae bacterium]